MAKNIKIAIIGGGSPYVPGILSAFSKSENILKNSQLVLMDINAQNLSIMESIGRRMIALEGASSLNIITTTDLKKAIEGADFVLNNFRPGGLACLAIDEAVPFKYGYYGQETSGPGGTFFALRAVPQVLDVARMVARRAPRAFLINYTNPTNFVADAVNRETNVRMISICDGAFDLLGKVPQILGLNGKNQVRTRNIGINHHTWSMSLTVNGQDVYPKVLKRIREIKQGGKPFFNTFHKEITLDLALIYGHLPSPSFYFCPLFLHDELIQEYHHGGFSLLRMFRHDLKIHWKNFKLMARGKIPPILDGKHHHTGTGRGDLALSVMKAIVKNSGEEIHVNVPNQGYIQNIPNEVIVELPARITTHGAQPLRMGRYPESLLGLLQSLIRWQELTVDAALTGDRQKLLQALLAYPVVRDYDKARAMMEEMLGKERKFLPQFFK